MSRAGRLPVAPRPFKDEMLSSWLGRVACRYGLHALDLAAWWAADHCDGAPASIDDFAPDEDQLAIWARSCGVDPGRVQRLSLNHRYPTRPPSHFSDAQWQPIPVCFACFDADHAAGRDSYLRACWMLAERCACAGHRRLLDDRCPSCGRILNISLRMREGLVRAVCSKCETLLTCRGQEGGRHPDAGVVPGLQTRIGEIVGQASSQRERFEHAVASLWAPLDRPNAARPVLALWLDQAGWRCPSVAQCAIGADAPLGILPVRCRATTLIAMRSLFGPDIHMDDAFPPAAAHLFRRAARPKVYRIEPSRKIRQVGRAGIRSATEYARLARAIVTHPDWIPAEGLSERRRRTIRARLVDKVLAENPVSRVEPASGPEIELKGSPPIKCESARRESRFSGSPAYKCK